jgi:hypothetical protein
MGLPTPEAVKWTGARRVLIDSFLTTSGWRPQRAPFREFTYSPTQRFARWGVSVMMTFEVPDPGTERLPDDAVSLLSDA